jgi:hypothetical protein
MDFSYENGVKFCRRVGERGEGPRPLIVGLKREWQKEDLLEKARDLRNTTFSEVVIIPDLTKEKRKEEAEMVSEVERRNNELSLEDRAKNLEWSVVGARGQRRMIKGPVRMRGGRGAVRGAGGGQPMRGGAARAPELLPARPGPRNVGPACARSRSWSRPAREAGQAAQQQTHTPREEGDGRVHGGVGGGDGEKAGPAAVDPTAGSAAIAVEELTVLYTNAQSLVGKIDELCSDRVNWTQI